MVSVTGCYSQDGAANCNKHYITCYNLSSFVSARVTPVTVCVAGCSNNTTMQYSDKMTLKVGGEMVVKLISRRGVEVHCRTMQWHQTQPAILLIPRSCLAWRPLYHRLDLPIVYKYARRERVPSFAPYQK